jgi:hypothetical protein
MPQSILFVTALGRRAQRFCHLKTRAVILVHQRSLGTRLRRRRVRRAPGQVSSGRLMTIGFEVLRTTTHRNGCEFDRLISICTKKAGTWMKSPALVVAAYSPFCPSGLRRSQTRRKRLSAARRDDEFRCGRSGRPRTGHPTLPFQRPISARSPLGARSQRFVQFPHRISPGRRHELRDSCSSNPQTIYVRGGVREFQHPLEQIAIYGCCACRVLLRLPRICCV